MGENTKIEWADHTFNPWVGCSKVSAACTNCYAESWSRRTGQPELWAGERRPTSRAYWRKPLLWQAALAERQRESDEPIRERVFCASLADVFEARDDLDGLRRGLWELIARTPLLDWLLLTKRPEEVMHRVPEHWLRWWPTNVWLGTTVENQEQADERIPHLLRVPARVRFLSCEPLLGPLKLTQLDVEGHPAAEPRPGDIGWYQIDALTGRNTDMARPCPAAPRIHWVIAGGESGPRARPSHPSWFRMVRDDCERAGVPFHFKQWGEWRPARWAERGPGRPSVALALDGRHKELTEAFDPVQGDALVVRVGKERAGRLLDGVTHDGLPVTP